MDREGIRSWQITRYSTFIEPDINVRFSNVRACGQNCIMLTHDYAVTTESSVS
jgi:hypothetical protein